MVERSVETIFAIIKVLANSAFKSRSYNWSHKTVAARDLLMMRGQDLHFGNTTNPICLLGKIYRHLLIVFIYSWKEINFLSKKEKHGDKRVENKLPVTTPTLLWVIEPHLYCGVTTDDFTRTVSPIFIFGSTFTLPRSSTWIKRTQYAYPFICQSTCKEKYVNRSSESPNMWRVKEIENSSLLISAMKIQFQFQPNYFIDEPSRTRLV